MLRDVDEALDANSPAAHVLKSSIMGGLAIESSQQHSEPPLPPLLALGALSTVEQGRRRMLARRTMFKGAGAMLGDLVHIRWLLPLLNMPMLKAEANVQEENRTFGDLLALPTEEGATQCWVKVILWLRMALNMWAGVRYVGVCDDDVYISIQRLTHELATLSARGLNYVYWGVPHWMGFWNYTRFEGEQFGGYQDSDEYAVRAHMRTMNANKPRQHHAPQADHDTSWRRVHACAAPPAHRLQVGPGPFIFMNTDLAIMGADLVEAVLAGECLSHFRSDFGRSVRQGRFVRAAEYPCEPNIDQLLGWLVRNAGRNVTLVGVINGMQGHSWGTFALRPPGSHSFYVHKLRTDWEWAYYDASLSRRFVPMRRTCLPCWRTNWLTPKNPSASIYAEWTCCISEEPSEAFEPPTFNAHCARERDASLKHQKRILRRAEESLVRTLPRPHNESGQPLVPIGIQFDGQCRKPTKSVVADPLACMHTANAARWAFAMELPIDQFAAGGLAKCVELCRECPACHYVSYSEAIMSQSCELFGVCKLDQLRHVASELCPTHTTVVVR